MALTRINREEFLNTLHRVEYGLSTRDFIEQSSCFAFQEGWVCSFNDEVCCRTKSGLPDDVHGAVKAAPLIKVLENLTDDVIDVGASSGELQIRGNRKRSGIRMESEILLPVEHVDKPEKWVDLPEDFARAIETVVPAAGTNKEEFITTCVHVNPEFLEATDRQQVVRYRLPTGVSQPFLVSAPSLKPVATLGLSRMGETENWIHFRNKTLVYSCRRHLDHFPDMTPIYDFTGESATLPRGATEAAKLGDVFSSEDADNKVNVRLTDGHMVVRGVGASGWAEASLDLAYHGPETSFRINPNMLIKLIENFTECEIGGGKLIVRGEKWTFLTVLGADTAASPIAVPESEPEPAGEYADT